MPPDEIPPHRDVVNVDELKADEIKVSSIVTVPTEEQIDAEAQSAVLRPSQHHEWIIFNRPAKRLLVGFLTCFLLLMFFQSFALWLDRGARVKSNRTISNLSEALRVQADREKEDQKFFDLVGRLIVIGPANTPEAAAERQDILNQLNDLRLQHEREAAAQRAADTTTTVDRSSQGSPPQTQGPAPPSSSTSTTARPSPTTTAAPRPIPRPIPVPSSIPFITIPTLPSIPQIPLPCIPPGSVLCNGTRSRNVPRLSAWVTVWRR